MKNQPEPNWIPTRVLFKDGASNPKRVPTPIFFIEEELSQALVVEGSSKKLNACLGTSISPTIDPADIESVYIWFYS